RAAGRAPPRGRAAGRHRGAGRVRRGRGSGAVRAPTAGDVGRARRAARRRRRRRRRAAPRGDYARGRRAHHPRPPRRPRAGARRRRARRRPGGRGNPVPRGCLRRGRRRVRGRRRGPVAAAADRLAPILMTALVTGIALLPLLFLGGHAGGEVEQPMALVIVGGLFTSTWLNLFVVPVWYSRFRGRVGAPVRAGEAAPP